MYDEFEAQSKRMLTEPIYEAGYRDGLAGTTSNRHDVFPLDRTAWVDGLRGAAAESKQTRQSIVDWMTRSRRLVRDA
jgi:hypothetical protein